MMNDDDTRRSRAMWDEMTVLHTSVSAIRKAQGKRNPSDCEANTAEYEKVVTDYVDDLERAMREAWWDRWPDPQR
ncbi:hypothetical protein ACTJLC_09495 [Paraburkholderia sp. 22099]|jgi:hypothetical protein|uniref:Uncharacterized protein n=1 Tax=Paraburkholderia terricola TaxID=169427 RepID=A0A1M6K4B4_9BURK|nr:MULTISPECIES: hypothetical protein [Paraburkholderia]ORC51591.1 hypothetical protein B2G74_02485 [Burkholderia sp. A27]AXE95933.1 hypothetical protein CUJ90_27145 [Paraburkholderia terricola]MDR6407038.1 hypothetical protein [Paraburkholderia terricola]MDR6445425.1 hypothetical protein [Paraburkholderia terricola]MDR6479283.1 hypothetical protein [Paraburkholderia terricola]